MLPLPNRKNDIQVDDVCEMIFKISLKHQSNLGNIKILILSKKLTLSFIFNLTIKNEKLKKKCFSFKCDLTVLFMPLLNTVSSKSLELSLQSKSHPSLLT